MLDGGDELDVKRTKVSDYTQLCAKEQESVFFCKRLRALKTKLTTVGRVSPYQAAFCPPQVLNLPAAPWCWRLQYRVITQSLPCGSRAFLCPDHLYPGTCNQVLTFLLCVSFSLHTPFPLSYPNTSNSSASTQCINLTINHKFALLPFYLRPRPGFFFNIVIYT